MDNTIHGKWSRLLPGITFENVAVLGSSPQIVVTVVADGVDPKGVVLPVQALDETQYSAYTVARNPNPPETKTSN